MNYTTTRYIILRNIPYLPELNMQMDMFDHLQQAIHKINEYKKIYRTKYKWCIIKQTTIMEKLKL